MLAAAATSAIQCGHLPRRARAAHAMARAARHRGYSANAIWKAAAPVSDTRARSSFRADHPINLLRFYPRDDRSDDKLLTPLVGVQVAGTARIALGYAAAAGVQGAERASRAVYEATLETPAGGTRTVDLGGHAGTTEFTDAVIEKIRTKIEIWSSL